MTEDKIKVAKKAPVKKTTSKKTETKKPISKKKTNKMSSKAFVAIMVAVCIAVGAVGVFLGASIAYFSLNNNNRLREIVYVNKNISSVDYDDLNIEAKVAKDNVGAVVSIQTDTSLGSGVIISENGYILTNYHVVSSASTVSVTLYSGAYKSAEMVSYDQTNDIALLKMEGQDFQSVTIGDSDNNVLGEKVVVIGNPTGQLPNSVSTGIISSLSRKIRVDSQNIDVIQINGSINSGNSGGALFNARGELIGIVNAKATSNSGSSVDGIGFAIPINNAMSIAKDLLELGYVKGRIMLGLSVSELNAYSGDYYYHIAKDGLFVAEPTGDALRAGIQAGDYIVSVDGKMCQDVATLRTLRDNKHIGDTLDIKVLRITRTELKAKGTGQITSQQFYTAYYTEEFDCKLTFTQYYPA